ncbi:MAG: fertility inhibition factor FiwA [Sphingobium sp.]
MFKRIRQRLALRAEIASLDAELEREPRPSLADPQLAGPGPDGQGAIVWRIPVDGGKDVHMTLKGMEWGHDPYVVPVCAKRFYRTWLRRGLVSQSQPDAPALRRDIPQHRKYRWAEQGFAAADQSNPVPLARVHACATDRGDSFAFTDGVTRTLWLIANGAKAFPVTTGDREDAKRIAEAAGIGQPIRVADLVERMERRATPPTRPPEPPQSIFSEGMGGRMPKPPRAPRRPRSGGYEL